MLDLPYLASGPVFLSIVYMLDVLTDLCPFFKWSHSISPSGLSPGAQTGRRTANQRGCP
jgi:hypothetical protein